MQVERIAFNYGWRQQKSVFSDFSLSLERGKVYGLLGLNGAGKSTLIYLMAGLLTPKSGRVTIDGCNVRDRFPSTLGNMFIVPEEFELPRMSLKEYATLNGALYPRFSYEDMLRNLEIFDINPEIKSLSSLSMGQKKKVLLARSLASSAHVYVWDEPLNYIDLFSRVLLERLIRVFSPTMLLVEHDAAFADAVATMTVTLP